MTEATRTDHSKKHPSHVAFQVREGKDGQKGRWTEIGAAWATKDGKGFTIQLASVPLDGKIVLREYEAK